MTNEVLQILTCIDNTEPYVIYSFLYITVGRALTFHNLLQTVIDFQIYRAPWKREKELDNLKKRKEELKHEQ